MSGPSKPSSKLVSSIGFALLTALWCFAVVVTVEVWAQWAHWGGINAIALDSKLGWRFRSHIQERRSIAGGSPFTFSTNALGFRDSKWDRGTAVGFRLLVLGDSYTAGRAVSDEQVFPRILEKRLPLLEVMNTGVSGWSTDQQLLLMRELLLKYQPDGVLLMSAPNDIREAFYRRLFVHQGKELRELSPPQIPLANRVLFGLSNYSVFAEQFRQWYHRHSTGHESAYSFLFQFFPAWGSFASGRRFRDIHLFIDSAPKEVEQARALFRSLVSEMHRECEKQGVRFYTGMIPTSWEVGQFHTSDQFISKPATDLQSLSRRREIPFINLLNRFRSEPNPSALYLPDDVHFSVKGHEVVAEEILTHLNLELNVRGGFTRQTL